MTPGSRRRRREGAPSPSPGAPMHEPLEESPCSITMAEVAKKDRKWEQRKGDARVGRCGLGYEGPRGGLSTPVAFNTSPIHQLPHTSPEGAASVSCHASGRRSVFCIRHTIHLIMASEPCEKANKNPSTSPPSHAPGRKASQ
jgi:hypothetical protein